MIAFKCTRCAKDTTIIYSWPLPSEIADGKPKESLCSKCMSKEDHLYKQRVG